MSLSPTLASMDTPVARQYRELKSRYPQAILLFRLGDFYETFEDDARVVARELEIVLTSREMGRGHRVPLAGIPAHSLDSYLGRLVRRGYKVAICEQLADPATVKGLIPRDVVRVVTPGTLAEPSLLATHENNYLAAALLQGPRAGLAFVDVSTGEFACTQLQGADVLVALQSELRRLRPAEIVVPSDYRDQLDALKDATQSGEAEPFSDIHVSEEQPWLFLEDDTRQALLDQFEAASLEGFGCAGLPLAHQAAGALILYLRAHQKAALEALRPLKTYSLSHYMHIDASAAHSLDIWEDAKGGREGSVLGVLDRTGTPMGGRLLRRRLGQPLLDTEDLRLRQHQVDAFYRDPALRRNIRALLQKMPDYERLGIRLKAHAITPRELGVLRDSLPSVRELTDTLDRSVLGSLFDPLGDLTFETEALRAALVDDPPPALGEVRSIRQGFDAELDAIEESAREAREWVASLEQRERECTGIKSLRVGYNRVFGYYIEAPRSATGSIPPGYQRKQTTANAERYVTTELEERERLIVHAAERFQQLERERFFGLLARWAEWESKLGSVAQAVATIDVAATLAEVAATLNWTCPVLDDSCELIIEAGRHPAVERALPPGAFVPNDCHLGDEEGRIAIITGPNMAGKSTYLRQVAIIAILAQVGSFVPAASARIGLVDRIFTRVGAHDDLAAGQSTFMVEMIELAHMLNHATAKSLLILDEIGRGTSTYDGLAIAQATIEYIHHQPHLGCRTLFATHYQELTALSDVLEQVRNYNVAVEEIGERVVFLHRIVPGPADRSYGIHVARLAGVPRSLTRRAQEILGELEHHSTLAERRNRIRKSRTEVSDSLQLSLLTPPDALVEELAALDVLSVSPLEALQRLFALHEQALKRLNRR
ncbi:MAG: DNA mismatch repair protein MutS [Chloroflexi bacterium]|nr:DNA mismatch repair protein MutS [Chloroflexota bacterium]